MSLVMLVAALVFVASFRNLMTFDPGMRQEGITAAFFRFEQSQLVPERYKDFQREVLAEVQSVPGVLSAGSTTHVPLIGGSWSHGITVGATKASAQFTWASPGYFETMGIRILQGRDFTLQDTSASPRVAVVNEAFVRRFIGSKTPLGEVLRTGAEPNYPERCTRSSASFRILSTTIFEARSGRSSLHPTRSFRRPVPACRSCFTRACRRLW